MRSRLPSNALAALIVPPFALMARDSVRLLRGVSPVRWLEAALLLAALAAVSFVVFHQPRSPDEAAVYVLCAAAAARVGRTAHWRSRRQRSVAVLALTAITGTLSRLGPFVLMPSAAISILSLQIFLIVAAATLMLMAAALAELHQARIAALRSKARLSLALNAARWVRGSGGCTAAGSPGTSPAAGGRSSRARSLARRADRRRASERPWTVAGGSRARLATRRGRRRGMALPMQRSGPVDPCAGQSTARRSRQTALDDRHLRRCDRTQESADEHRSQREKLAHLTLAATVGELAGTLAHEMSQPLAAIMLNATVAQQEAQKPSPDIAELRAILADILADDQRAADVIHRLHALLPRGPIERESVQVADCINDILALEHSDLIARNVVVELDIEPQLPRVTASSAQLQQVLLNLIVNACQAMAAVAGPRQLRIVARQVSGEIHVGVSDNGSSVEDFERIFEPFYSSHQHVGLGLSTARSIVVAHGWAAVGREQCRGWRHLLDRVAGAERGRRSCRSRRRHVTGMK
jgi:C4-dicarboxylate-specific signal transduction histidine kinase